MNVPRDCVEKMVEWNKCVTFNIVMTHDSIFVAEGTSVIEKLYTHPASVNSVSLGRFAYVLICTQKG
jgi:hypothetical protein